MSSFDDIWLDSLYCLFKGEPGTRKSTAALSFPKPIYFFSWDRKIHALKLPMQKWGINPADVHFDPYMDWTKGQKKLETLQVNCPYKTIVIDTVTSLADATNKQTLKDKGGPNKVGQIAVNSIEDYKAEESVLMEMIARTKDIYEYHKINVIIIAHIIQKEMKSADGKTHMSRTLVTAGKAVAQKIPAYCDEVYHFNIKTSFDVNTGGQYALLTTHTGDDFARTSLPLEREIIFGDEPLYDKWLAPAIKKFNGGDVRPTKTVTPPTQSINPFTK